MSMSSSQAVDASHRVIRLWRGWLKVAVGVVVLIGVAATVAMWITLTPRQFSVTLTPEAIPPDELGRVVRLLREADWLEKWTPGEASEANLDLLVKHLRANPQTRSWYELKRSGSEPRIGLLNGALSMLALSPASTSDTPAPEPVRIPWQSWGDRPLQVSLPPGSPPPPQPPRSRHATWTWPRLCATRSVLAFPRLQTGPTLFALGTLG